MLWVLDTFVSDNGYLEVANFKYYGPVAMKTQYVWVYKIITYK